MVFYPHLRHSFCRCARRHGGGLRIAQSFVLSYLGAAGRSSSLWPLAESLHTHEPLCGQYHVILLLCTCATPSLYFPSCHPYRSSQERRNCHRPVYRAASFRGPLCAFAPVDHVPKVDTTPLSSMCEMMILASCLHAPTTRSALAPLFPLSLIVCIASSLYVESAIYPRVGWLSITRSLDLNSFASKCSRKFVSSQFSFPQLQSCGKAVNVRLHKLNYSTHRKPITIGP
jgi:hypothetical protein